MKHLGLFASSLAIVALLAGMFATPSHAWPWSSTAGVEVTIVPNGVMAIDSINCQSASLSGNGRYYTASVTNPFLSNKCVFKFSNVYVGSGLNYTLTFQYKYYFSTYTKSVTVYVARPALATYTKTVYYTP